MRYLTFKGDHTIKFVSASILSGPHLSYKGNLFSYYFDSGLQFAFEYFKRGE